MNRAIKRVDISNYPDLMKLAEEVRETGEPRMLTRDHEALAMLIPTEVSPKRSRKRPKDKTKADYEAFMATAGSWKDVDDE